ncbi:unnamed protein product [Moneuplotes crassus]|uniref:Uncharacterized protein n=1 Tax=Euplotes crassus TaxID=5936 RepID=A0AAD2D4Y7_EUPCR|nr:unnamed protein product [Moneuplotes crassus]
MALLDRKTLFVSSTNATLSIHHDSILTILSPNKLIPHPNMTCIYLFSSTPKLTSDFLYFQVYFVPILSNLSRLLIHLLYYSWYQAKQSNSIVHVGQMKSL